VDFYFIFGCRKPAGAIAHKLRNELHHFRAQRKPELLTIFFKWLMLALWGFLIKNVKITIPDCLTKGSRGFAGAYKLDFICLP